MKRIVRLTESDLVRLVKRVIKEEQDLPQGQQPIKAMGGDSNVYSIFINPRTGMNPKTRKQFACINCTKNDPCSIPFNIVAGSVVSSRSPTFEDMGIVGNAYRFKYNPANAAKTQAKTSIGPDGSYMRGSDPYPCGYFSMEDSNVFDYKLKQGQFVDIYLQTS